MIQALTTKKVPVILPAALVAGSATPPSIEIDTAGWTFASIYLLLGNGSVALSALNVEESDTKGGESAGTLIAGTDYSVSPATLPGAGAGGTLYAIDLDLLGRKRFLKLVVTLAAGTAHNTTVNGSHNGTTQTVLSTAGWAAGNTLYFGTAAVYAIIDHVASPTSVVLTAAVNATDTENVTLQLGAYLAAHADLSRPGIYPTTPGDRGLVAALQV